MGRTGFARMLLGAIALVGAVLGILVWRSTIPWGPGQDRGVREIALRQGPPNMVVIVMDTTRRDRLSVYGYDRETSPRLRSLAETGTVFLNAHSTSSWTAPAHVSLFTGLYPITHGTTQERWIVNQDLVTLAEILSESGYHTAAIVENPVLVGAHGYAQGFMTYDEVWHRKDDPVEDNPTLDSYTEFLDRLNPDQPFFLFVNLIEPHSPYNSSGPFLEEFLTDPSIDLDRNHWRQYYVGRRQFTSAEIRHLNELYDAELLFTDSLVGSIEAGLRSHGLWDRTLFLVTSDHGENIGDHEHMDHVFSLYETTTRIPLLVHYPPLFPAGCRDSRPVQIVDIFPTLLTVAGIDARRYPSQGKDLLRDDISADRPILCEYYYPRQALQCYRKSEDREDPRLARYKRRIRSIEQDGWKLIWGSDGVCELYDLKKDPLEETDLFHDGAARGVARKLVRRLTEIVGPLDRSRLTGGPPIPDSLDAQTREALRSLGYL